MNFKLFWYRNAFQLIFIKKYLKLYEMKVLEENYYLKISKHFLWIVIIFPLKVLSIWRCNQSCTGLVFSGCLKIRLSVDWVCWPHVLRNKLFRTHFRKLAIHLYVCGMFVGVRRYFVKCAIENSVLKLTLERTYRRGWIF